MGDENVLFHLSFFLSFFFFSGDYLVISLDGTMMLFFTCLSLYVNIIRHYVYHYCFFTNIPGYLTYRVELEAYLIDYSS